MKNQVAACLAVFFGSMYTISRKYQCIIPLDTNGKQFNEPMLQTFIIFFGMVSILFFRPFIPDEPTTCSKKKQSKYAYIIPSILDVLGTISDTAGLYYTSVSVSQMLKGSTLFFTYLISVVFFGMQLKRKQHLYMLTIVTSLGLIGYSNTSDSDFISQSRPLLGNILIVLSQMIFALMFIAEEKIIKNYNVQIKNAVLWQGIWGILITGCMLILFSNLKFSLIQHSQDTISAIIINIFHCDFSQSCSLILSNSHLLITMLITGICISPFNYFGILITKNSSALQRCMICTSRMVIVWLISLFLNWQKYNSLQFIGYVILSYSIYEYNRSGKKEQGTITQIDEQREQFKSISQNNISQCKQQHEDGYTQLFSN